MWKKERVIKQRIMKLKNEKMLRLKKLVTSNDICESLIRLLMIPALVKVMSASKADETIVTAQPYLPVTGFIFCNDFMTDDFTKLMSQ